jgi:hypothetical protein
LEGVNLIDYKRERKRGGIYLPREEKREKEKGKRTIRRKERFRDRESGIYA